MADLPSILGGMAQGFLDFGKSAVDLFGTGGASIADLIESARTGKVTTRNSDDFRKWLYDTNDVKDAAAKGLGTALNGVQTVSDYIPGIGAVTRNPLFNAGQGALGGLADEFKMYGKDYDLGRAGQRAAVGAGGALASTGLADALKGSGNALLKSGTAQGLARGAVGGAIGAGGYTAIDGGSLGDVANSALQGAGMGAALGGTMGALQDFKPARNYDMALTDEEKAARIANAKNMLANEQDPERIAELNNQIRDLGGAIENAPSENMKLYRGISAPDDATLQRYIDEMKDPNIAPTTYSGGSAYGQGYYFTPDEGLARYYANESGLPSTAIMEIEVPRNRFTEISKENGNRPADFDLAAVKRGVPEDIRYETGLKDFNDYLDNNGYWGSKTGGENPTYTIMRNDAVLNAKRIDAPSLETTLSDADMAVNSPRYLTDENGNPRTFYHGSPNANITEFDINRAGKNTMSGEHALYFTDSPEVADEFSYERIPTDSLFVENRGAKGRVYPVNLEMNNPLDLDNLTDAQIDELWPYASYMGSWQGKDVFTRDIKNWRDVNNAQLIKGYLDMDKLAGSPYDGFIARMYPNQDNQAREYAVFDNSKIKMLEDVLANDDMVVNSAKIAPGQLGLFDDMPTQMPKTGTRQTSLFDQPQEGLDYYGEDIEGPATSGPVDRSIEDLTKIAIDESTLPKGWKKAQELANMGKRAKQIVLDPNDPNRARNEYNVALYSDAQYGRNMPVADVIDRLGQMQYGREVDRGAARLLADQLDESGDEFAKKFVTGAAEAGGNISHYRDAPKAKLADEQLSNLLNIGRSNSMLSDSLANPSARNARGDQWKGTINLDGKNIAKGSDGGISTFGHERLHAFQDAGNMGYDQRVVDAYNELHDDLSKIYHSESQIRKDYGNDVKYWSKPIEQEARMAQFYLEDNFGVKGAHRVPERDASGKTIRYKEDGTIADPNNLREYYTGKPAYRGEFEGDRKAINAAFDKFRGKLQDLTRKGVALPALTALFGGGALMANQQKDKEEVR